MFYRPTNVEVDLGALSHNIKKLVSKYSDYDHHFAVVKADCYGHGAIECTRVALDAGCDYLCVATLDEAMQLRPIYPKAPILCLGVIDPKFLNICAENNITITLGSLSYIEQLPQNLALKAHIKINTGMNRLGLSTHSDFSRALEILKDTKVEAEGIYTHIYQADNHENTEAQFAKFEEITADYDLSNFKFVHLGASDATEFYPKRAYANTCRLGISMYGLVDYPEVEFESTFKVASEIVQINEVSDGTLGYNGTYKINGDKRIAIIPAGYADGIIRKNSGREVYINNKAYPIVGNICMDMLFVLVDNTVKVGDKVWLIKDIDHIKKIADYLETIPYEIICNIGKRIPRIYER